MGVGGGGREGGREGGGTEGRDGESNSFIAHRKMLIQYLFLPWTSYG